VEHIDEVWPVVTGKQTLQKASSEGTEEMVAGAGAGDAS